MIDETGRRQANSLRESNDAFSAPVVSVVMSVFNGGEFLQSAIDSVLEQTFKDFEFIIFDDGSWDGSSNVLARAAARDQRIVLERLEHKGLTHALNRGLRKAKGEFIARMDADDISVPHRFENQVRFLRSHRDIALVGSAFELIDENSRPLKIIQYPLAPEDIEPELAQRCVICHPSIMARLEIMRELGGYRPQYLNGEDYDLWLRLVERYRLANLPDVLLRHRQHTKKISVTGHPQQLISTIVARQAAVCRRVGGTDPTDTMKTLSLETLSKLGMQNTEIDAFCGHWVRSLFALALDGRLPLRRVAHWWLDQGRRMRLPDQEVAHIVASLLWAGNSQREHIPKAASLLALTALFYPLQVAGQVSGACYKLVRGFPRGQEANRRN